MPEPHILLTGLAIGESPRWHADRRWFSRWGAQAIVAVDLQGNSEVMVRCACMLGGKDRRTLFMMVAKWHGTENMDVLLQSRTGRRLAVGARHPGLLPANSGLSNRQIPPAHRL